MRITFIGPASVHLGTWTKAIQDTGVEVSVITCHGALDFPVGVPLLELESRLPSRLNLLSQARRFVGRSRRDPDLVVASTLPLHSARQPLGGRPYVVVAAGTDVLVTAGRRPYWSRWFSASLSRAAAVVCWSDSMKDAVLRFGVPPEKVMVLPRGINVDSFLGGAANRQSNGALRKIYLVSFGTSFIMKR